MMRYAAHLSFKTPRLDKSHLRKQVSGNRFQVRRFDGSFIFTCPVQTWVGELDLDGYAYLRRDWVLHRPTAHTSQWSIGICQGR